MQPPPQQEKAEPGREMGGIDAAHPDKRESRDATANFANPNAVMPDFLAGLPGKTQLKGQITAIEGKMASYGLNYSKMQAQSGDVTKKFEAMATAYQQLRS